ncbi:MAG TPA: hypothetical protein VF193_12630 [Steroidobacter sp.]
MPLISHGLDKGELHTPGDGLLYLARLAWSRRLLVSIAAFAGGCVGLGLSFAVTPTYRSEVLATYVTEQAETGALAAITGELGGLAALAGLGNGPQNQDEVLAFLESRELGRTFIESQKIGPSLIEYGSKFSLFDRNTYDWREAYRVFDEDVRRVVPDKKSGGVKIAIEWPDRTQAARWANEYVALANRELRNKALAENEARLQFLYDKLQSAPVLEIRDAVARLIESEMRSSMVANARTDFALKVIDPAVEPRRSDRHKPRRGVYAFVGFLLSIVGTLVVVDLRFRRAPG